MDGMEEKIALHLYIRPLRTVCRIYYSCGLIVFFQCQTEKTKILSKNQDSRRKFEFIRRVFRKSKVNS